MTIEINKTKIDDNGDGSIDKIEFDDMINELQGNQTNIIKIFQKELNENTELKKELNSYFKIELKKIIHKQDLDEKEKNIINTYKDLFFPKINKKNNLKTYSIYIRSVLYETIKNLDQYIYFLHKEGIIFSGEPNNQNTNDQNTKNKNIPSDTDIQNKYNFLEEIGLQNIKKYIKLFKKYKIILPKNIIKLEILKQTTPETLKKIIEICNKFQETTISSIDEINYIILEKDPNVLEEKLNILTKIEGFKFYLLADVQQKTPENITKLLTLLKNEGINSRMLLISGLLGQTNYSIEETQKKITLLKKIKSQNLFGDLFIFTYMSYEEATKYINILQKDFKFNIIKTEQLYRLITTIPFDEFTKFSEVLLNNFGDYNGNNFELGNINNSLYDISEIYKNIITINGQTKTETLQKQINILKKYNINNGQFMFEDSYYFIKFTPKDIENHIKEVNKYYIDNKNTSINFFFLEGFNKINKMLEYQIILNENDWLILYREEERVRLEDYTPQEFQEYISLIKKYKKNDDKILISLLNPKGKKISEIKNLFETIIKYGIDINYSKIYLEGSLITYLTKLNEIIKNNNNQKEFTKKGLNYLNDYLLGIDYYTELFLETPGAYNLFKFLENNPQKLTNLGGKEIKELDLNTESNSSNLHRFRGILEMVKSRDDINLPIKLQKNATEEENTQRESDRTKIIKEYENFLKYKISLDFTTDKNGNKIEKPKDETFDQIFYCSANKDLGEDRNGAFSNAGEIEKELRKYTKKETFLDYSSKISPNLVRDRNNPQDSSKLISAVKKYNKKNPNKKILVFIGQHGGRNGDAGPFSKQDFLDLANISSNIKIVTNRCNFGYAYDNTKKDTGFEENNPNDYIYDLKSPVSGYSNKHDSYGQPLLEGLEKGLGFNEAEIYVRTQYFEAFAPMTESREYKNRKTGKTTKKNIGITNNSNIKKYKSLT